MTQLIPDGWSFKRLEELCDASAPITYGVLKPGDFNKNGIPLLQIKDMTNGSVNLFDLHMISPELDNEYKRSRVIPNDILVSLVGTVGRVSKVPSSLNNANIHRNIGRVRSMFHEYLYQYLISDEALYQMGASSSGSSQSALNLSTLRSMKILTPPLAEQKKITEILGTWDEAIENVEKQIDGAKAQKKALMQQLLSAHTRFPHFTTPWQTIKLGDVADIKTGASKTSYIIVGGQFFIVDMGSISREGKLVPTKRTNFSEDFLSKGNLVMPKDDIGGGNIIGRTAYIDENHKYIYGDHIYILKPKDQSSIFLNYLINSYNVNKSLRRKANGTAQLGLGKKDVIKQPLELPPLPEQKAIAQVLDVADAEISNLQAQLEKLKAQKKGLMQQLLTGKTRVKVDKEAA